MKYIILGAMAAALLTGACAKENLQNGRDVQTQATDSGFFTPSPIVLHPTSISTSVSAYYLAVYASFF